MLHCFPLSCWALVASTCGFAQSGACWEDPLFYNCINTLPWAVGQIMQISLPPIGSVGLKLQPETRQVIHDKEGWPSPDPICAGSGMVCHLAQAKAAGFLWDRWNWYWTDPLGTTGSTAEVALGKKMNRSHIGPSGIWLGAMLNSALQDNIALSFILSKQAMSSPLAIPIPHETRERLWNPLLFVSCTLLLCFRLFLAHWQFVLQVVKQNVHFKINYSKILINSFFRRESHVFLLHTSSSLLK